ncbi:MAG: malate permease [Pirellulaceae bacterium]|nr:malate permease [Pirellulaceae bacterium]
MISHLWLIVSSVFGVLAVILVGGLCRRLGWLRDDADHSLASLTANVLIPALFIDRILAGQQGGSLSETWLPPLFGFTTTAFGFAAAYLLAKLLGPRLGLDSDVKQRSFAICVGICNYGYIPLPLAEKFYPDAVVDLILHNVGVDLALWSVGIAVLCGLTTSGLRRVILNPPLIAVIVAVTIKQTIGKSIVPEFLLSAAGLLGDCAIPMGLLLSGAILVDFLRQTDWSGSLGTVIAAIGFRQLLMPILILAAASLYATSVDLRQVLMLQAAMPTAIFPVVLIRLHAKDTATALRVVLSTSIAAVVLIPIWLSIGKWWLAI